MPFGILEVEESKTPIYRLLTAVPFAVSANGTSKSVFGESLVGCNVGYGAIHQVSSERDRVIESLCWQFTLRDHQNTSVQVHQVHLRVYFHELRV